MTHRIIETLCATDHNQLLGVDHGFNKASPRRAILQVNPETAERPNKFFSNVKLEIGQIISVLFYERGVRKVVNFQSTPPYRHKNALHSRTRMRITNPCKTGARPKCTLFLECRKHLRERNYQNDYDDQRKKRA